MLSSNQERDLAWALFRAGTRRRIRHYDDVGKCRGAGPWTAAIEVPAIRCFPIFYRIANHSTFPSIRMQIMGDLEVPLSE